MRPVVHIPWYATVFRGDRLEEALEDIAPVALRYGAAYYELHRSRDDQYKMLQVVAFDDKLSFIRYWDGPEFSRWRAINSGFYPVPVYPVWNDIVVSGKTEINGNGNGGNGAPSAPEPEPVPDSEPAA